jgi:allantoinase
LQLGLRAVWTEASNRGVPLAQIADFMAAAPARLAGLAERKGRIAVGCDGDIVVFDPDDSSMVIAHALYHRHPVTPYHGRHLRGRVISTLLRGDLVFDQGNLVGPPSGRLIHRSAN